MAGLLRRRAAQARRDDRGFSLVELLSVMVLLSIVMSITTVTMIKVNQTLVNNRFREDSLRISSVAMENMTKALRAASPVERNSATTPRIPAFKSIAANDITFYTNLSGNPRQVQYNINAARSLRELTTKADGGSAPYYTFTGTAVAREIGSKIPTSAPALFRYYDDTGTEITTLPSTDPLVLEQVRSVDITITVQADARNKARAVTLVTRISLPGYNVVAPAS
jgi:prepilin-type N-terminal cleavage/methylation domain-containing protein